MSRKKDTEYWKRHLCDSCDRCMEVPECLPGEDHVLEVKFGTGNGLDNIVECPNYERS